MSLRGRLAISLLALLLGLGGAIALVGRYASEMYFHEIHQTLNASISMYVVERLSLIENGGVNEEALGVLADRAMTINPSVEVYLVGVDGAILSHQMPTESVLRGAVDLEPIRNFLNQAGGFPILGTDPRSTDSNKAFSVAPIETDGQLRGYLYVILGGQQFDAVRASFLGSFIGRLAIGSLAVLFVLGGFVGFLILRRTTRPLELLEQEVRRYAESDFKKLSLQNVPAGIDEISGLKAELQRLSEKLTDQFEQIETNDRLKRELFANVSHDLRTPLSSMQGYLETLLIKDAELGAVERRQYVATAHQHTKRLNDLVGDLFQLAKLDSGAVDINIEPFLMSELVQDVVHEFTLDAREKGVNLFVQDIHEPSTSQVQGDIGLMQRVLENLIGNAVRHTPAEGEVVVTLTERDHSLCVLIKDSGQGIEASLLPRIFDRYASGSNDEGRSGLGLAIVKRILDLHGSDISVVSSLQEGTRFTFMLPLRVAA
ncbi:MAG: HAMP domain-containing protein [Pseudomonadales bacterium]|nr:HAMP domain-containing protein [Pseudomonadales bacterium]